VGYRVVELCVLHVLCERHARKLGVVRLLFTCVGSTGHFHPLVPIAREAVARGHEVVFATGAAFCPFVEAAGFRAVAAGFDYAGAPLDEWFPQLRILGGEAYRQFVATAVRVQAQARRMVPDLLSLAANQGYRPDVVVRDAAEYGGCVAAEVWDVPHASVRTAYSPSSFGRRQLVGPGLAELRREHKLPPDPDVEMPFRYLHLACEPPGFWPADDPSAPTSHLLQPAIFDRLAGEELPPWIAELPKRPTVCATLGTYMNRSTETFEAILRGVRVDAVNLIVLVGHDVDPTQFGFQPDNVHIERYVPLSLLLPHCDLVISHAGFGTIVTSLANGLPSVLIPLAADQPDNARSCARLGAARVLGAHERSPGAIPAAVRQVLTERHYRALAEHVRTSMQALPGVAHAVRLLERLASERQPIPAQSREVPLR
jgi:MGT family glycosyltransferase